MRGSFERLQAYIADVTNGASLRSIAVATDMDPSTLSRQIARRKVPVDTVVAIARAYHGDLLLGLVVGGYITEEEAAAFTARGTLSDASDLQIAQETLRRMRAASPAGGAPLDAGRPGDDFARRLGADSAALDAASGGLDDLTDPEDEPGAGGRLAEERRILTAQTGPHAQTRRFAADAAALTSDVSVYDEAAATEDQL